MQSISYEVLTARAFRMVPEASTILHFSKYFETCWNVATGIVWAWILTIPASALLAGVFYCLAARLL